MQFKSLTLLSLPLVLLLSTTNAEKVTVDPASIMKSVVDKLPDGGIYHFDHVEARVNSADGDV